MDLVRSSFVTNVAPYVGAWIETSSLVIGLEGENVAPYVGAWIETGTGCFGKSMCWSHPTWVRGLKLSFVTPLSYLHSVAPYVGAWIETLCD